MEFDCKLEFNLYRENIVFENFFNRSNRYLEIIFQLQIQLDCKFKFNLILS